MHISFFNGKTENIYQIIHKRFLAKLLKTAFFFINKSWSYICGCVSLDDYWFYTATLVLIKIDHAFYLIVFKCIQFCFNIFSKFSLFWFFLFSSFSRAWRASRSSLYWFFMEFIFSDLNGSSFLTFAICCSKSCAICCSNASLFTKLEMSLSKRL